MYSMVDHVVMLDSATGVSDIVLVNSQAKMLTLQVSNSAGLNFQVFGCSDIEVENWEPLGIINLTNFDTVESASGDGVYASSVEGIYRVKLNIISGSGRVTGTLSS